MMFTLTKLLLFFAAGAVIGGVSCTLMATRAKRSKHQASNVPSAATSKSPTLVKIPPVPDPMFWGKAIMEESDDATWKNPAQWKKLSEMPPMTLKGMSPPPKPFTVNPGNIQEIFEKAKQILNSKNADNSILASRRPRPDLPWISKCTTCTEYFTGLMYTLDAVSDDSIKFCSVECAKKYEHEHHLTPQNKS